MTTQRRLLALSEQPERAQRARQSASGHFLDAAPSPQGRTDHYVDLMKPAPSNQPVRKVVDKTGQKFGRLEVIGPAPARRKSGKWVTYWRCRCECGNERDVMGQRLGAVIRPTQSCGCLRMDVLASKDPIGQLFTAYKRNVFRQRATAIVSLTLDEFSAIITGNCDYCGRAPHMLVKSARGLRRNTVDRVDPFGDYAAGNCVSACWPCNRMKRTYTAQEFLGHAQKIAAFQATRRVSA